jgi:hypothetical protein
MIIKTPIGIYAEWILGQIPKYINARISKEIKSLKPAKDGLDGISITETYFAPDGHLMIRLSSGKEIDAGSPNEMEVGSKGHIISTQVAKDQIYVSTTAPTNPQLNQLWYDIT